MLKARAGEKVKLANKGMDQIQNQAQIEALAFQVSLRNQQIGIHLLKKTIEQKTEGNNELTKFYDDLISKMGKIWHGSQKCSKEEQKLTPNYNLCL